MPNELADILNTIAVEYNGKIQYDSNLYHLITLTYIAKLLGDIELTYQLRDQLRIKYPKFRAIVPLKDCIGGIKKEFKGSELSDYVQINSGILVPESIAKEAEFSYKQYKPKERIIINFRF